jgi:hypothetical protein
MWISVLSIAGSWRRSFNEIRLKKNTAAAAAAIVSAFFNIELSTFQMISTTS